MKQKLIEILTRQQGDEEKAMQITALVPTGAGSRDADELGEELVAFRKVIEVLGECEASEVSISPKLVVFLCFEMEKRTRAFFVVEGRELRLS